jgi:hypothetical protein
MVKIILRKQSEIVDKERITKEDMYRAKILSDMLNTVSTINDYYKAAPDLHRTPMQKALDVDRFGVRPSSRPPHKLTPKEEEAMLKAWEEDDAAEEAELRALKEKYSTSTSPTSTSTSASSAII